MIQDQLDPLFKSIYAQILQHDNINNEKIENLKKLNLQTEAINLEKINHLQELNIQKDDQIRMICEIRDRLKNEMDDFLKVSFASRWKKKVEEVELQNEHLKSKMKALLKVNEELNHHMDQITKQDSTGCQTTSVVLFIETKKGAKYSIKEDILYSENGNIAGHVVDC
jgi:hypothetical protein